MTDKKLQQFASYASCVEPSFWHKLSQLKLDVDRLEEKERLIWGYFSNIDSCGNLSVDVTAFNKNPDNTQHRLAIQGSLINKNTIEAFKECDKAELLQHQGKLLADGISSGEALHDPALSLGRFLVLSFADLKKYHFYYWFAFLAPKGLTAYSINTARNISEIITENQVQELDNQLRASENKQHFCVCISEAGSIEIVPFSLYGERQCNIAQGDKVYLAFADPSNLPDVPGWPLRSILWLAATTWPHLCGETPIDIMCVRQKTQAGGYISAAASIVLQLSIENDSTEAEVQWVGWERNERGKLGPRLANLSSSMDPVRLAENAVDFNLKLMKWRLLPQIDLATAKNAKCLLLGAGTLGCAVARVLMGWGVRKITFVDSGRVSYSNPVRQTLFMHKHCIAGGSLKAYAAAESLKEIFPGVDSEGVKLSIPMPGHTVTESQCLEIQCDVKKLEDLIASHDVIFLLTDTRESRWLPTLLGKLHEKIVINAALGFDSFLVMRHGVQASVSEEASALSSTPDVSQKSIPGHQLGCYFCNDVVAPRNSMAYRSLDQQCTVVRPGVAQIAAALAVELLVSVLQHPDRGCAPASCDQEQISVDTGCVLGLVPHSIRGFLAQFQLVLPASHAFVKCAACSAMVLDEYRSRGFDFLLQAFNSPGYLEEITGLAALQQQTLDSEMWALSDSEDTE